MFIFFSFVISTVFSKFLIAWSYFIFANGAGLLGMSFNEGGLFASTYLLGCLALNTIVVLFYLSREILSGKVLGKFGVLNFLAYILIVVFWLFLLFSSYQAGSELIFSDVVELVGNLSIADFLLYWVVSLLMATLLSMAILKLVGFLKKWSEYVWFSS